MREDSDEFEDGIILQEFRKGFKLGDRLLRPSMVKVSAGPGPAKPEQEVPQEEEVTNETSQDSKDNDGNTETESAWKDKTLPGFTVLYKYIYQFNLQERSYGCYSCSRNIPAKFPFKGN